MDIKNIGDFLRDLRLEHGMSQDELSEKLFVSRQAISNWEVGKSVPDYDILLKLSDLYNIKVEEILRGKIIYKNKIYRFITNIFSEKSKKKKLVYNIVFSLLFIVLCFMIIYFINTFGRVHIYTIDTYDDPSGYSCYNGFLSITEDRVLYKNCDLKGFDNKKITKIKYYYLLDGKERLIELRENSDGIDLNNNINTILSDDWNYEQYFDYSNIDEIKNNVYVDVLVDGELKTLKLYFVEY